MGFLENWMAQKKKKTSTCSMGCCFTLKAVNYTCNVVFFSVVLLNVVVIMQCGFGNLIKSNDICQRTEQLPEFSEIKMLFGYTNWNNLQQFLILKIPVVFLTHSHCVSLNIQID
jgi:C4-type Zn-finger protein